MAATITATATLTRTTGTTQYTSGDVIGQSGTADPTSDAVECMALAAWR